MENIIFIIGQHRTGSTLLKNMLDAHSQISMAFDEMSLCEPFRKNTIDREFKFSRNTDELINKIFNKRIYGGFWWYIKESDLNEAELKNQKNKSTTVFEFIKNILYTIKTKNNANFVGVKYPIHFSKIDSLLNHFPNAKILFITRNPKAIIASKINDPASLERKNKSIIHKIIFHYLTMFYFIYEYNEISKIFKKYKTYKIVRYEDLISSSEFELKKICNYIGISFEKEMLNVSGKKSSFLNISYNTINVANKDIYKNKLNSFDNYLIDLFTQKSIKRIKRKY